MPEELRVRLFNNGEPSPFEFLLVGGPLDTITEAETVVIAAIGHAAGSWARVEKHIDILLVQINKATHDKESLSLYDPEHPRPFIDKLKLLKRYFNRHPALDEHTKTIRAIASELKTAGLERNKYLHSTLGHYDAKDKMAVFHTIETKGNDDFQVGRIKEPLERIINFTHRVNDLNRRLAEVSKTLFSEDALRRLGTP